MAPLSYDRFGRINSFLVVFSLLVNFYSSLCPYFGGYRFSRIKNHFDWLKDMCVMLIKDSKRMFLTGFNKF